MESRGSSSTITVDAADVALPRNVSFLRADMRSVSVAKCDERCHVIARIPTRKELLTITHLARRPAINIDFKDISYNVPEPLSVSGGKTILKGVSGSFRSGELTAILGSSGAGKSTLMNILAGYVTVGVAGTIETNGHPRQLKLFNKLTSYIMQDDLLQPYLTVEESMIIAANLKLGKELSQFDKEKAVNEILTTLLLDKARNVRTERLSGGQRKRLSVALELVSNPPVIFLDEPTTGLDVVSTNQLITLLKKLARQGRTIICTIHQPEATVFKNLDLVYVMTSGECVYQGTNDQLVPFLANQGLECPVTHNPADFVMESISIEATDTIPNLVQAVQNGKLRLEPPEDRGRPRKGSATKLCRKETMAAMPKVYSADPQAQDMNIEFPTSYMEQTWILLKRKMLQQTRNMATLWIMICHHLVSAFLIGLIFIGVGNDGLRAFENFKFIISCIVFFVYTHVMCNVLLFPFEVKRLRREYFNRWYGLKAYFTAHTLSTIPHQIILGFVFVIIAYPLTNQPIEFGRITWFYVTGVLTGLASEGLGLTVGALFKVMNGCAVGPATVIPMLAVGVYGMGFGPAIEPLMRALMYTSYLRYGITGLTTAVLSDREKMTCPNDGMDVFCPYADTKMVLRDLGMEDSQPLHQVLALLGFIFVFRLAAFLALRQRLTVQFSNWLYSYMAKVMRIR